MPGFIDLHCHWIAGIDDGAPSVQDGLHILRGLGELGFDKVFATPHMRPGLFENTRAALETAFTAMLPHVAREASLPAVALSSEHYFDDVVYGRICTGEGLPYPGERAVLLEFYEVDFPYSIDHSLASLCRRGMTPVIAHPERYQALWRKPETLERLLDIGCVALLDVAALVGKYGRRPQACAERFLEDGLYAAACSDAHRPADVEAAAQGMARIRTLYGAEEIEALFAIGPRRILGEPLPEAEENA
jgi:protein-tyrosine phosphatase